MKTEVNSLISGFRQGKVNALARIITLVENRAQGTSEVMKALYPMTGNAYVVGITGPPGAGKSTLTEKITKELRKCELSVGIIAVDPTSPFTKGAMLGDRLRMQDSADDPGVFIRSMASRGALGGLSRATGDVIKILDAFGKQFVLVETVGVGQDEVEIVKTSDTIVLVSTPGQGDDIQAMKAGIMEIGDIFVVNKADREGADRLVMELQMMLDLSLQKNLRMPPVLKAVATTGEGVNELTKEILLHQDFLKKNGNLLKNRARRAREEVISIIEQEISEVVHHIVKYDDSFDEAIEQIVVRKRDPYSFVRQIVAPLAEYYKNKKDKESR